jgi:hypothetical protein
VRPYIANSLCWNIQEAIMGTKLRLFVVAIGALLVVATFTYPQWRPPPIEQVDNSNFPGLPDDLQADFQLLPERIQVGYLEMNRNSPQQALVLLQARLSPLLPLEQTMTLVEGILPVQTGALAPLALEEEDDRTLPPFSNLYTAKGDVSIYELADSRKLLQIQDLAVVNGPELWLALTLHPAPLMFEELGQNYYDVGRLNATLGNLEYALPSELDVEGFRSIVIYDRQSGIIFAAGSIG